MCKYYLIILFLALSTIHPQSLLNKSFQDSKIPNNSFINTNKQKLLQIAKNTRKYLKSKKAAEDPRINSLIFKTKNEYIKTTKNTLDTLIHTLEKNNSISLDLLNKNFNLIKWNGDAINAAINKVIIPDNKIRLTKYLVFRMQGSNIKTPKFQYALYSLPKDEFSLSDQQIEKNKKSFIRFKYTKQDIINGVLETPTNKQFMEPLVWLTREGLEEAIMQGTTIVETPDGKERIFNVYKSNDIPYIKQIKDKYLQKRYWYFKEVKGFQGYGYDFNSRIQIIPEVTFAGDVRKIGIGTLIALSYINPVTKQQEMRLGIVADYGGAFDNNLYQLDYFVGAFNNRNDFQQYIKQLPEVTNAYILIKKDGQSRPN